MPLPKPREGEEEQNFIARCIRFIKDEDPDISNQQAVAMAYSQWKRFKK